MKIVAGSQWAKAHFFIARDEKMVAAKEEIVARINEIARRVGGSEGIEIVDVEFLGGGKNRLLRIYIDRPEGVTHADCEFISAQVGTILDVEDVIPGDSYTLEVSSPGVERKLATPRDFERVLGQKVRLSLREPAAGPARVAVPVRIIEGKLSRVADQTLDLETASGEMLQVRLEHVHK